MILYKKLGDIIITKSVRVFSKDISYIRRRFYSTSSPTIQDRSKLLGSLGVISSFGVIALIGYTIYRPTSISSNSNKQPKVPLKRFQSFTTKLIDDSLSLSLVASVVAETITPSTLVERYDFLTSLVGDGSYGRVFKAKDKITKKEVAVKIVPHKNMSADQIYNEVDILRKVRGHENIIHLFQVLNCDEKYYIVSELCKGGELLQTLIDHGTYKEEKAVVLMQRLASAIKHIHCCGFVHADLKPENIVFAQENNVKSCRVIDFGVSKDIQEFNTLVANGERLDQCIGTMAYAAPELIRLQQGGDHLKQYDARKADMWSLGIILFICLYGCHPFDVEGEGNQEKVIENILHEEIDYNEKIKVSPEAKDLLKKLLNKDPNERITTDDLMEHPFIYEENEIDYLKVLPNSWVQKGFKGGKNSQTQKILEEISSDEGKKEFLSDDAVDMFARSLLIASLVRSVMPEKNLISTDEFFLSAFDIISNNDEQPEITIKDLDALLTSTNEDHGQDSTFSEEENVKLSFEEFRSILNENGCVSRNLKKGSALFSQGSEPQGFYILIQGKCGLEFNHEVFSIAKPGSMFGESALEKGRKSRAVTIRALEDSQVCFIPKNLFFKALAGSPALQTKIFEAARLQQAKRLRNLIETLLGKEEMEKKTYKQGEYIYESGEEPKALYFIEKGLVASFSQGLEEETFSDEPLTMKLAQRGKNDVTGTSVFFQKGKRYCSVQCLTDVEVLVLKKEKIFKWLENNQPLQFYLESQAQWRVDQWNQRLVDLERGVTEPQLLPILLQFQNQKIISQYAKAVEKMERRSFQAGEKVFNKGEECDRFYIVNSGTAAVEIKDDSSGEVMTVAQFEPGDHFGEDDLIHQQTKHTTSVKCVVPCEILSMKKEQFFQLMNQSDFSNAIEKAIRMRQHRWGKNLLALARSDEDVIERDCNYLNNALKKIISEKMVDLDRFQYDTKEEFDIERLCLKKDEVLFKEGDISDAVYYIHQGELKLNQKDEVKVRESGDAFGLDSMGNNVLQESTAVCVSDRCIVSKIPKNTMDHLIRSYEFVSENLKKHAARVTPLMELERNVNQSVLESQQEEPKKVSFLTRFFSFLYKSEEVEEEESRGVVSFSDVMEELSKT